jgi:hypothetical protein
MAIDIKRRDFIFALGSVTVLWSPAASAQQPVLPVIGFLNVGSADAYAGLLEAFRQSLGDIGYIEG